ncbi:hypothetical protein [Mycobacterium sp. E3198]|uniref:hypothetical protein n=1 Tax=Mycobacterium sp. E3198 TaxID=1834143 RepID=UPI00080035F1|nr:hypothetical protein [Mycobacterium sp. E3198]OBG25423.1 hypothetical protein A5673_09050 [Mycobacterium sp. E3198]
MRIEATRALYKGLLADLGERNPYAGRSVALARLWLRGYLRMPRVPIETWRAMAVYLDGTKGVASLLMS